MVNGLCVLFVYRAIMTPGSNHSTSLECAKTHLYVKQKSKLQTEIQMHFEPRSNYTYIETYGNK